MSKTKNVATFDELGMYEIHDEALQALVSGGKVLTITGDGRGHTAVNLNCANNHYNDAANGVCLSNGACVPRVNRGCYNSYCPGEP